MRLLHRIFNRQYIGQIIGGDFAKFCGLPRIYELYGHLWPVSFGIFTRHFPTNCAKMFVKFRFLKKVTTIWRNPPVDSTFANKSQINWKISSNFCGLKRKMFGNYNWKWQEIKFSFYRFSNFFNQQEKHKNIFYINFRFK